ncbi:MAG TPA: DUF2490 domain-containing protein [Cyclobacteriaceae bacterium]
MNKHLIFLVLILSLSIESKAQQKNIETQEQTWFGYFNQTRFTKRSGLWLDLHLRLTNDFVTQKNQSIIRTGYTYYISDQVRATAGYAYVTQYGLTAGAPDVPEHRVWQQIQWFEKKPGLNLMQWLRVEERYRRKTSGGELINSYNFNWRFRYNIALTIPLKGKMVEPKTPFLFFNDEILINAGKNIVNNYFDQNRLSGGFGYQLTAHLNAQLGYMYVFQQKPSGHDYLNINAIRLFVFHNMDFRKTKE